MKTPRNAMTNWLATVSCALGVLATPLAQASLINNSDGSFTDTGTGYLWRTLSQYDGLDYASALVLLPSGYHAASEAELATLTAAAPANPAGFAADYTAMGASSDWIIWGFYGDGTRYLWKTDYDTDWISSAANASGWINANYPVPLGSAYEGLSLFAVDTGVAQLAATAPLPEPATLSLFGVGLIFALRKVPRRAGAGAKV